MLDGHSFSSNKLPLSYYLSTDHVYLAVEVNAVGLLLASQLHLVHMLEDSNYKANNLP